MMAMVFQNIICRSLCDFLLFVVPSYSKPGTTSSVDPPSLAYSIWRKTRTVCYLPTFIRDIASTIVGKGQRGTWCCGGAAGGTSNAYGAGGGEWRCRIQICGRTISFDIEGRVVVRIVGLDKRAESQSEAVTFAAVYPFAC